MSHLRGHVQMTSVLRGGGGVSQLLTIGGGGCVISILRKLTGGGGGSKIPKIRLTSFVHGPLGCGLLSPSRDFMRWSRLMPPTTKVVRGVGCYEAMSLLRDRRTMAFFVPFSLPSPCRSRAPFIRCELGRLPRAFTHSAMRTYCMAPSQIDG